MNQQQQEGIGMDEAEREALMEGEREGERERERERENERDRGMDERETAALSHGAEPAMVNEAIRGMEAVLFNAARKGNVVTIREKIKKGEVQTTPTGKTVLHIASEFGKYECVEEILKRDPDLLFHVDRHGDTALHVAARMGHVRAAKALIEASKARVRDTESGNHTTTVKEFIRMTNNRDNTALHEAVDVMDPSIEIVRLLVEEYPEYEYLPNKRKETPVYVAAERGHERSALAILRHNGSVRHDGPLGRTTLHAAVMSNLEGLTKKLLEKGSDMTKQADDDSWTPLHWAAYFDHYLMVIQLLKHDRTLAYIMDKDGLTSLHVASMNNCVSSMKTITTICPDCYDMVDHKGRNAFHYAIMHGQMDSTDFLLGGSLFSSLLNEGDKEGNTALHLCPIASTIDFIWNCTKLDYRSLNNRNETINSHRYGASKVERINTSSQGQILRSYYRRFRVPKISMEVEKEEESKKERGDTRSSYLGNQLVVAALIATVSFAAGFTLPGGYNDSGKAILSSKPMFKAFVIADTLAFLFSMVVVFLQFYIPLKAPKNQLWNLDFAGYRFTPCAMLSMLIAFITGVSVALESSGLNTALQTISVVTFLMFSLIVFWIKKLFKIRSRRL